MTTLPVCRSCDSCNQCNQMNPFLVSPGAVHARVLTHSPHRRWSHSGSLTPSGSSANTVRQKQLPVAEIALILANLQGYLRKQGQVRLHNNAFALPYAFEKSDRKKYPSSNHTIALQDDVKTVKPIMWDNVKVTWLPLDSIYF